MGHSDSGIGEGGSSSPEPGARYIRITLSCKSFYNYCGDDSSVGIYLASAKTAKFRNVN